MVARKLVQEQNIGSHRNLCVAMNAQKKNNEGCFSSNITPRITCLNTDIASMNFSSVETEFKSFG